MFHVVVGKVQFVGKTGFFTTCGAGCGTSFTSHCNFLQVKVDACYAILILNTKIKNTDSRHSRENGNPGISTTFINPGYPLCSFARATAHKPRVWHVFERASNWFFYSV